MLMGGKLSAGGALVFCTLPILARDGQFWIIYYLKYPLQSLLKLSKRVHITAAYDSRGSFVFRWQG